MSECATWLLVGIVMMVIITVGVICFYLFLDLVLGAGCDTCAIRF